MVALIIMIPVLSLMSAMEGIMAAFWIANKVGAVPWTVFYSYIPKLVEPGDITAGLIKSIVFAVTISLIGCVEGMNTHGGAFGVGRATTNAVVVSMVSIFGLNYVMSMLFF